ncbi:MAG: FIST N-terminal domain-containing protein [Verrucomicrobiae bacterium]|nr:FIST N-terminal domain-containing protein [Verrucomicrobiae bacterium]
MSKNVAASGFLLSKYEESKVVDFCRSVLAGMKGANPTLGLVFMSPEYFSQSAEVLELIRLNAHVPTLIGCSGNNLVGRRAEVEGLPGLSLLLLSLPESNLTPFRIEPDQVEACADPDFWRRATGVPPGKDGAWLAFADPFHFNTLKWVGQWNGAFPGVPLFGGLASGRLQEQSTQIYLNSETYTDGGLALALRGGVEVQHVVSQGCMPIGEPHVITKSDGNFIFELGSRPAYAVLVETLDALPEEMKPRIRGNLFLGVVINEYLDDFKRGDFLIRNLFGADEKSGALAVGDLPRVGQTVQFHLRDKHAATEDLREMLSQKKQELKDRKIIGGVLFCCNGRGRALFGHANHDAEAVAEILGDFPLAGFFCNGEFGPVGGKNYVHGYTASLALFVETK